MTKHLTRRELYDLVWARPMTKVAAELGISDVALHKICDRHRVPAPGRGYWAKVAAGKKVKPSLFRELDDPTLDRILITGGTNKLPPDVLAARNQAKEAAAARRAARNQAAEIVPTGGLHPLVARLQNELEKRRPESDGYISTKKPQLIRVRITHEAVARTVTLLQQFTSEAEMAGYQFESRDDGLVLIADGEIITFSLSELLERVRHEPTEKEVTALQKWESDRERKMRLNQWYGDWDKPKIPAWDHIPSGNLSIELDEGSHWDGLRRRYSDGQRRRLETLLDSVITAVATLAAQKKTKRKEDEQRKREWEEAAQRRQEAERRERRETQRRDFLTVQMGYLSDAERIDAFVQAYKQIHGQAEMPPSCGAWLQWASEYAARLRHHIRPERLAEILDKHLLMDEQAEVKSWIDMKREAI